MGTRRTDGEGSYGRTSDGRHTFTRQIRLPDGALKRVKGEGKSRTLARQRCERRIAALLAPPAPPQPSPLTVGEQIAYWLDTVHRNGRATTNRTYRWVIDHLVTPTLGGQRLVALKSSHLKRWIADMEHAGRAARTIGLARMIVKAALDLAVQDELIVRNPVVGVKVPRVRRSIGKALTGEQAQRLLASAHGHRLELAIRLMLGLGLRRGEVTGLHWRDIDQDAGMLHIRGAVSYTPETGVVYGNPTQVVESGGLKSPALDRRSLPSQARPGRAGGLRTA